MKIEVRRRPLVFEAEQWFPGTKVEGVFGEFANDGFCCPFDGALIKTLEGTFTIKSGYWVVTGIAGEQWGVAPEIFWKTYERLEEDEGC